MCMFGEKYVDVMQYDANLIFTSRKKNLRNGDVAV